MAKVWELLDQTYYFINKQRYREAQSMLDRILYMDPQNIDAWDAYIQLCKTPNDLLKLKNYISQIWETRVRDQDYLLATQRFILQRVDEKMNTLQH